MYRSLKKPTHVSVGEKEEAAKIMRKTARVRKKMSGVSQKPKESMFPQGEWGQAADAADRHVSIKIWGWP